MGAAPSKTTKEILDENKNAIRSSIREITREQRHVDRRRREVESKIKKSAKEGRMVSLLKECEEQGEVRIFAKDLVRIKNANEKFEIAKANLEGIQIQLLTASGQEAITSAMKGACAAYKSLNRLLDPKAIQRIMSEYSKASMRQEMMAEVMEGAMDNAMGDLGDEAEEDELVDQVLAEIGIEQIGDVKSAPANDVSNPVSVPSSGLSDLQSRVNNL